MKVNHTLTLAVFAVLVFSIFGIVAWAARRTKSVSDFFAAGQSISSAQNGLAMAGDFMSAGTFLGTTGLIYLYGLDGVLILVAALFSFLPLMIIADRLRNAGVFTLAEILSLRFNDSTLRAATAITSLVIVLLYMFGQLVGAGIILQALAGISFFWATLLTGGLMTIYVAFGGMIGATWVMIIKAVVLVVAGFVMSLAVVHHAHWSTAHLMQMAIMHSTSGAAYVKPGGLLPSSGPIDIISYGLVYMLGVSGLPHVLIRLFTVRDGVTARKSLGWAVAAMGSFYVIITILGVGARALLDGDTARLAAGVGGNLVAPILAGMLGGGLQSIGGVVAMTFIAGVSFLTILAVVSGLLLSAAGAVAHDLFAGILWKGRSDIERRERVMARVATVAIGALATAIATVIGSGFNITFLLGLGFLVAASANLPVLACTLFWPRFSRMGAVLGMVGGLCASIAVIVLSPTVMGTHALIGLKFPAIISMPAGFIFCWLGTVWRPNPEFDIQFASAEVQTELPGMASPRTATLHH